MLVVCTAGADYFAPSLGPTLGGCYDRVNRSRRLCRTQINWTPGNDLFCFNSKQETLIGRENRSSRSEPTSAKYTVRTDVRFPAWAGQRYRHQYTARRFH